MPCGLPPAARSSTLISALTPPASGPAPPRRHGSKIALNSAARRKPAMASWRRACALVQSSYDGSSVVSPGHPPVEENGGGVLALPVGRRAIGLARGGVDVA